MRISFCTELYWKNATVTSFCVFLYKGGVAGAEKEEA